MVLVKLVTMYLLKVLKLILALLLLKVLLFNVAWMLKKLRVYGVCICSGCKVGHSYEGGVWL